MNHTIWIDACRLSRDAQEAAATGRARAQHDQTERVIHRMDGSISERHSYGTDFVRRTG